MKSCPDAEQDMITARQSGFDGVALSLAAAAIYGVLAPAAKGALAHIEPVRAAGLTYLAVGCVALGARTRIRTITRSIIGIAIEGGN